MLGIKSKPERREVEKAESSDKFLVSTRDWRQLWDVRHIYPLWPCPAPALEDWIFHQYFELLRIMESDFDTSTQPWVPVGACGPVLVLGHVSPEKTCILPDYACQKVVLSVEVYKDHLLECERYHEQVYTLGTDKIDPLSDKIECYEGRDVFRAIKQYLPIPEHLRPEIHSLAVAELQIDDLPDGLSECYYRVHETRPFVDLGSITIEPEVVSLLSDQILNKFDAVPFFRDEDRLYIASSSYPNHGLSDRLGSVGKTKNLEIVIVYASEGAIRRARENVKSERTAAAVVSPKAAKQRRMNRSRNLAFTIVEERIARLNPRSNAITPEDLAEWILAKAVALKSSDIHIEQLTTQGRIRLRIDGVAKEILRPPLSITRTVVNVLKTKANMGQDPHVCEDGGMNVAVNDQEFGVRVSAMPYRNNHIGAFQTLVMRLQAKTADVNRLSNLRFSAWADRVFRKAISRPSGINLVTGPTGSGKTTTLYAALLEINRDDTKIVTVEDPIEREIDGLSQVQVSPSRGVTFSKAMRTFLRQDPDVILVGEIRDKETASLAIEASLTGHLVFSTLHTNSAIDTLDRLLDLGIERSVLASALTLLQSQRLVRSLCPKCKTRVEVSSDDEAMNLFQRYNVDLPKHVCVRGIDHNCSCGDGYQGRRSIMELVPVDREIKHAILEGKSSMEIRRICDDKNFPTLIQDGLMKVAKGDTTIEQVLRFSEDWD